MSQNRKSATQETFTVFVIKEQRFRSHSKFIQRKNKDAMKEVLFIIVLSRYQQHFKIIYIANNVVQFSLITRWDETQKTAYWRKNRNRTSLRPKIAQRTTLFQRSRAFLIKSLSVLPFLDAQGNKSRSVVTILSEVTRLLRYLKYKAIASSIFYQKE